MTVQEQKDKLQFEEMVIKAMQSIIASQASSIEEHETIAFHATGIAYFTQREMKKYYPEYDRRIAKT